MMLQVMVLDRHETVRAVLGHAPGACPILEDLHTEDLENADITYEFAVPADHPDAWKIENEGYVILRDLDARLQALRIKRVETEVSGDGQIVRKVMAENAALELNGSWVPPQTMEGVTAQQALETVLTGTRWKPGTVEWVGLKTITIEQYQTVLATVHQIAQAFGGELRWRIEWDRGRVIGRYVDILQRRGRRTGKRVEYQKDTDAMRIIEDTSEIVTAMIGLGRTDDAGRRLTFVEVEWSTARGDPVDKPLGQEWVGDPEAVQRWGLPGGRHLMGVYEDSEETDPAALLQKTWDALQERLKRRYTYEITAVALERIAGLEHEAVRLGDTVTVHNMALDPPLILEARVVKLERSYTDPTRDRIILGYYEPAKLGRAILDGAAREVRRLQTVVQTIQARDEPAPVEITYRPDGLFQQAVSGGWTWEADYATGPTGQVVASKITERQSDGTTVVWTLEYDAAGRLIRATPAVTPAA